MKIGSILSGLAAVLLGRGSGNGKISLPCGIAQAPSGGIFSKFRVVSGSIHHNRVSIGKKGRRNRKPKMKRVGNYRVPLQYPEVPKCR